MGANLRFNIGNYVPCKKIIARKIERDRNHRFSLMYSFFILPAYQGYHGLIQFINLFLLFQYPDKPSRRKESIVRIIPAHQGLHTAESHIHRADNRLIIGLNPAFLNGFVQMSLNIPRKGQFIRQLLIIPGKTFSIESGQAAACLHSMIHTHAGLPAL